MQRDVAPYLWSPDAFCVPSLYEIFLLVGIESAAAGRLYWCPRLNGVEDYLIDGENGIFIERIHQSISAAIEHLVAIGPQGRHRLGEAAQRAAQQYTQEAFVANWDELIKGQLRGNETVLSRSSEGSNMPQLSDRHRQRLVVVAGILYTMSLHKYSSRDALSDADRHTGPAGVRI